MRDDLEMEVSSISAKCVCVSCATSLSRSLSQSDSHRSNSVALSRMLELQLDVSCFSTVKLRSPHRKAWPGVLRGGRVVRRSNLSFALSPAGR